MVEGTPLRERRARQRGPRDARHVAAEHLAGFAGGFRALGGLAYAGVRVSATVLDLDSRNALVSIDDHTSMPTAELGQLLLLIEVSARMSESEDFGALAAGKTVSDLVSGSGLWQHLLADSLTVADLASLVGARNDKLAANALLRELGLESVHARTEQLGLRGTALLDRARESRGPDDAPQQSIASMSELAGLMLGLTRGEILDPLTSSRVLGWLSLGSDLSMAASAFGLTPLGHRGADHGLQLVNTTGSEPGVRVEAGALRGPRHGVAYAVAAHFTETGLAARLRVLDAMRSFGLDLLDYVH